MNETNMSDMMQKLSSMMNGKEMPDNIKNILQNFTFAQNNNASPNSFSNHDSSHFEKTDTPTDSEGSETNNPFANIDIGTMMKIKSMMDKMNSKKNDPRANLLRSLKPYLKPSRKEKVDQYVQLFAMTDLLETWNTAGGDQKK